MRSSSIPPPVFCALNVPSPDIADHFGKSTFFKTCAAKTLAALKVLLLSPNGDRGYPYQGCNFFVFSLGYTNVPKYGHLPYMVCAQIWSFTKYGYTNAANDGF